MLPPAGGSARRRRSTGALRARLRRRAAATHAEDDAVLACDLLAACLLAGSPVQTALAVVGASVSRAPGRTGAAEEALPGSVGAALASAASAVRLGAGPAEAAEQMVAAAPALAGVARAVQRSATAGTPLAPALLRLAADSRADQRWRAEARARRVGTYAALPVALCFLPAFVLLGVVPLVVGLGDQLVRL